MIEQILTYKERHELMFFFIIVGLIVLLIFGVAILLTYLKLKKTKYNNLNQH